MKISLRKNYFSLVNSVLVDLPVPSNISYLWNFGSLLGMCLGVQLLTGIFLSLHYSADVLFAFSNLSLIMKDLNWGWVLRYAHANGASLFFVCIYAHIGRGLYYLSYSKMALWMSGVTILLVLMASAFLGYVLPWGQMSFWGATVITNLFSAIPYLGEDLVIWLWGGFSVNNATLVRFFSFHFLFPFILLFLVLVHIELLHVSGSNNPLGLNSNVDKLTFSPLFLLKDLFGMLMLYFIFFVVVFYSPNMLGDPDNFNIANPLVTPIHIQPEWYFLYAYAILRSIPNKLGGVLALASSIVILYFLPFVFNHKFLSMQFYPHNFFWLFVVTVLLLTWLGSCPVEYPYEQLSLSMAYLYFFSYLGNSFILLLWDKLLD